MNLAGFRMQAFGEYEQDDKSSAIKSRDWKDATDLVTHTLRAEGHDASEDGTGRGTPLVAIPIQEVDGRMSKDQNGVGIGIGGDVMFTLQAAHQHGIGVVPIDMRQASRGEKMTNNRSEGSIGGPPGTGIGEPGDPAPTVAASHTPAVAFQTRIARNGRGQPKEITDALTSADGGTHADSKPHVATRTGIRRLTPRECERLQGFPDDWTRFDAEGKELSDSARYRTLGNAVCVSVAEWIGKRIAGTPPPKTQRRLLTGETTP